MGYAGKHQERSEALRMRSEGMRIADIATHLAVSKGTVSGWVREVPCPPMPRRLGPRRPSRLHLARLDADRAAKVSGCFSPGCAPISQSMRVASESGSICTRDSTWTRQRLTGPGLLEFRSHSFRGRTGQSQIRVDERRNTDTDAALIRMLHCAVLLHADAAKRARLVGHPASVLG
jgi:hypothetical protein